MERGLIRGGALKFRSTALLSFFEAPAERIIAQGRLGLATLCLVGIYFDPIQPAQLAYNILVVYLVYSAVLVGLWQRSLPSTTLQVASHVIDIGVACILMLLTEGYTSPLFVFFTFTLLAATLRWDWEAVAATTVLVCALFIIGAVTESGLTNAIRVDRDLDRLLIRSGYLIVTGGLLCFVSAVRERTRERLARLAAWRADEALDPSTSPIAAALSHTGKLCEAPRVLVVWTQTDSAFKHVALCDHGQFHESREAAERFGALVRTELAAQTFITKNASSNLVKFRTGPAPISAPLLDNELIARFHIASVATAAFHGTTCAGRIFILDRHSWSDDHLLLTELVSVRMAIELDRAMLQRHAIQAAAGREKIRLMRDLHDGLLQSLTAAGLQLEMTLRQSSEEVSTRIRVVQRLIKKEQHRVRDFVQEMRSPTNQTGDIALIEGLQHIVSEAGDEWSCATSLKIEPEDMSVSQVLARQVILIISEAIANAVRHGHASKVDVLIREYGNRLSINISDNGRGFGDVHSNDGTHASESTGPRSLRERVHELGGSLTASTSSHGVELELGIPLS
jgi:signal transduction histidine kinase